MAQIAAALGRTFSHDLISATATMPKDLLDDALEQLVGAELVFQRGVPPRAEYTFKHALVQDAAYSTLLHSNRQQLHGRIATVLETRFSETAEAQPELLARHFLEAGMVAKAIGYLIKAGRQAIARGAMAEAVAQLSKGLDRLSLMPDRAAYREQELTLQMISRPGPPCCERIRGGGTHPGVRKREKDLRRNGKASSTGDGADRPIHPPLRQG